MADKIDQGASDFVNRFLGTSSTAKSDSVAGPKSTQALSVKERVLVKSLAGGATIEQAAKGADMSKNSASSAIRRQAVKDEFKRVLKEKGLDDDSIADAIKQCLNATATLITHQGDEVTVPDFKTRLATAKHLSALLDHMPDKEPGKAAGEPQGSSHLHLHFDRLGISPGVIDRLDAALKLVAEREATRAAADEIIDVGQPDQDEAGDDEQP